MLVLGRPACLLTPLPTLAQQPATAFQVLPMLACSNLVLSPPGPRCTSAYTRPSTDWWPAGPCSILVVCCQLAEQLSVHAGGAVRRNVARERRVGWERTMAELALQLGDLQGAICHALQVGLPSLSNYANLQLKVAICQRSSAECGLATVVPQRASSNLLCVAILLACWSAGAAPAGVPAAGAGAAAAAVAWPATVLLHGACYEHSSECCVVTLHYHLGTATAHKWSLWYGVPFCRRTMTNQGALTLTAVRTHRRVSGHW